MSATNIALVGGNNQSGPINSLLPLHMTVIVTDGSNQPVSGVNVLFTITSVPSGATGETINGSGISISLQTNFTGTVPADLLLGNLPGTYIVTAVVIGLIGSPVIFTQMATPINAIASLADVKTYLKKTLTDVTQDPFIQLCINSVSSMIERYIGGPVVVQSYTEIYDGSDSTKLFLRKFPVVQLANNAASDLQNRPSPVDAWVTWETDINYIFLKQSDKSSIALYRSSFYKGEQNFKVSYKAGYPSIPAEIYKICIEAAAEMYNESPQSGQGRLGRQSVGRNEGGISVSDSYYQLSSRHKMILASYKLAKV